MKNNNQSAIFNYARAALTGAVEGVMNVVNDILHPLDNLIYPISDLLYDATLISAGHINATHLPAGCGAFLPELDMARAAISMNPSLYTDATNRMQQRLDNLHAAGHQMMNASGPEKVHMASSLLSSILVPGAMINSVKAMANLHHFGLPFNPPSFLNYIGDRALSPVMPGLTLQEVRAVNSTKSFIYVITEDKRLIITPNHSEVPFSKLHITGKIENVTRIHHSDLARLIPVYQAGELLVENGLIKQISNGSGHYLPFGEHLQKMTETFFKRQGYSEAIGKYRDLPAFGVPSPNVQNMIPNKMGLFPSPAAAAGAGVLNIIAEGLKESHKEQQKAQKEQQANEAKRQLADVHTRNVGNFHADRLAYQQVMANTRCFNLPFDMRHSSMLNSQHLIWRAEQDAIFSFRLIVRSDKFATPR